MDFKNKLMEFWGYVPTFHDDDVIGIILHSEVLKLEIKTNTSKVLHPKYVCEQYETVYTTIKYDNANITKLEMDKAGLLISKVVYEKINETYVCKVIGLIGLLEFTFSNIIDLNITTKTK